ncbi:hypothetical protein [Vibrio sp. 99-70-13A1]|uniref:hypothetical protein n=1 Tax=Vibrio sp. 99-70-13A1 TaxID=2607601 RepID=UPI001493B969|nr:hypothetical protein [Vibrio sp. 99-70-13A1]NOH98435.1 hypothetical protein [Vibrio sp. 99-70-13A1]
MKKSKYDADLIINTSKVSDGRYVIDLNLLTLDGYLGTTGTIKSTISGVNKATFDKYSKNYSKDLHREAEIISGFIITYKSPGRRTIFNVLKEYLDFQVDQKNSLRDPSKLPDYCIFLQSRVYKREISRDQAGNRLSTINSFLSYSGDIYSNYKYTFSDKTYRESNDAYDSEELSKIIQTCFIIFETSGDVINEHLDRSKQGFRDFSINDVTSIKEVKLANPKTTFDYIVRNPVYWFMHSAFILFCFFTWSNEQQLKQSNIDDFNLNADGVDSELIYKGRAHKFIRLNIGKSGIEGERTGIEFYKRFIKLRLKLVEYLKSLDYIFNHRALLFMINQRDNEVRRLNPALKSFERHPIVKKIINIDLSFPKISSRRLRKTVEQITDRETRNPFTILDKAQHNWGTYRKNYAQGNKIEARKAMGSALKKLTEASINGKNFKERKEIAKKYDVMIVSKGNSDYQLNGIVCTDIYGNSPESNKFKRQQSKDKRTPKLCANLSNCMHCSKCAVIEDENAIYQLLSFQHMIDYNKPIYIGSSNANESYQYLTSRIDLMLAFVDTKIVARARKTIQDEGVFEIWKI